MNNNFDMEQQIMKVWGVADDMEDLADHIIDGESPMSPDEIFNALYGLSLMLNIKCEKLFSEFEKSLKLQSVAKMETNVAKKETYVLSAERASLLEKLRELPLKEAPYRGFIPHD